MTEESPRKKGIQPEMMVAVSAVFIGVCALAVSLYETKLMREEQRSAVLPILELGRSYYTKSGDDTREHWRLSLHADNVGIGPARIHDFVVTVDGKPHPTWRSAFGAMLDSDVRIVYGQSTINGRTIPPDRSIKMFDLSNVEFVVPIVAEFERLDFEACFCSVFDECWKTSYSAFGATEPVAECKSSADSFTE
jgi:hypothetical protein